MTKYYALGPAVLGLRDFPTHWPWSFWEWKLDAYRILDTQPDLMAEYAPAYVTPTGTLVAENKSAAGHRRVWRMTDGTILWQEASGTDQVLQYRLAADGKTVTLCHDTTGTHGVAALEALNFFVFPMLLTQNVLTFHSVLLEHKGQGILIAAPSGVGKTTHARLWRDTKQALIINGDRSPCYQKDGRWMAFGTPWCGTSGENVCRQVPIKAMVLLRRGEKNRIVPLSPMEMVQEMLGLTACPVWGGYQDEMASLMDAFIKSVPVVGLSCTPNIEAVQILEEWLEALP